MKKTLLATGILAAMMSTSSIAATVYKDGGTSFEVNGRAEARFNIKDDDNASDFTDKSRARVSFVGQTDIAEGYYAFGKYELEASDNNSTSTVYNDQGKEIGEVQNGGSDIETRYLFAGVGSEYGRFSYGKQDTIAVALSDMTDTMETFGGAGDILDYAATELTGTSASDKVENNFAYVGTFDALTVGANYVVDDSDAEADAYTIGGAYAFDFGLTVGAGYYDRDDLIDGYMVAAQYTVSDFTFGAMYNAAEAEEGVIYPTADTADIEGYELSASYNLDKFTFTATYNAMESEEKGAESEDEVDEFAVEGVYKFNRNFRTYVGYKFQQLEDEEDEIQAGLRYDF